jgi:hypothetical protein
MSYRPTSEDMYNVDPKVRFWTMPPVRSCLIETSLCTLCRGVQACASRDTPTNVKLYCVIASL